MRLIKQFALWVLRYEIRDVLQVANNYGHVNYNKPNPYNCGYEAGLRYVVDKLVRSVRW